MATQLSPVCVVMLARFGVMIAAGLTVICRDLDNCSLRSSPTVAAMPKLEIVTPPLMVMNVCGDEPRSTVDALASVAIPPPIFGSQFELATSSVPDLFQLTPSKTLRIGKLTFVVLNQVWNSCAALPGPLAGADAPAFWLASAL